MLAVNAIKKRLQDLSEIDKEIASELERYDRVHSQGVGISSPGITDMPRNPSPEMDKMTDLIIKLEGITTHIRELRDLKKSEMAWLNGVLKELRSADEKTVIRLRYIDRESWRDITFILFGDKDDYLEHEDNYERKMYRIHGNALTNIMIEDGKRHG